jgi:hypothetical protein
VIYPGFQAFAFKYNLYRYTECARLMKTLTTLKGAPAPTQNTYLAGLLCCAKCEAKKAVSKVWLCTSC